MSSKLCPKCGRPYKGARCPRCSNGSKALSGAHSKSKRTQDAERARKAANPWRVEYGRAEYRKARQAAITRSGGRCAACGKVCAECIGGRWRTLDSGGVHHIVPLSGGGTNAPSNLVLLCVPCHNRADALRRSVGK